MGAMDTRIFGVEGIVHIVTPMVLNIIPAIGARGIKGHKTSRTRLRMPPSIRIIMPVNIKMRREKKPMMRETRRSKNI